MKLDIYVCETRRCVMWLIEHGYPIFDQKIKRGKTQVKYRFYFDEIEGIEEMTKGWLIKANLKRYQVEIDGKTYTFRNDIALGVVDEHNDDCYFVGTTYTPVDTDSCTDSGCVCWSRKEFGEKVDTWSIVQQFFTPDRPRKSKSKRVQALRKELNDK